MAQGGFGVVFKVSVSSTLTAVADVLEAGFPEFERMVAEATGHDAAGGYAKFVSTGKRKLNEFTIKVAWSKNVTTHAAMRTAFDSETPLAMSIADPDAEETIAFDGLITKVARAGEQEDVYVAEITIQPTGQPTIS